jgi:ADP-heptose:LPS heptosyltransferase
LSDDLKAFGAGYVGRFVVEPHIKGTVSGSNKDWGWTKWQELVDGLDLPWAQFDYGRERLRGVEAIPTDTFWHGVAVLGRSIGIVTTDGGLHHAAAALSVPAVVIWGGYAPPAVLGYRGHINLSVDAPDCLGMKVSCTACRDAMDAITVNDVETACRSLM